MYDILPFTIHISGSLFQQNDANLNVVRFCLIRAAPMHFYSLSYIAFLFKAMWVCVHFGGGKKVCVCVCVCANRLTNEAAPSVTSSDHQINDRPRLLWLTADIVLSWQHIGLVG